MQACSTDRLYHYLLDPAPDVLDGIRTHGLLPLSHQPRTAGRGFEERLAFYRALYVEWAQQLIGRPYENSGIFLTPIDFRLLSHPSMARCPRVTVPLQALDRELSFLTWVEGESRVVRPLSREGLEEAARRWPADQVIQWFGRIRTMLFFYVPQVVTYQARIVVQPDWIEA
ncbi:MAG: hypothetical protein AB1609_12095 [Bacillota bacterium]